MHIGLNLPRQVRVYSAFFFYALALGGLYPRLGDIQLAMGIKEGALGTALIGIGAGTLVSLTFADPVLERLGYKRTMIFGIIAAALIFGLASFSTNTSMLFATLFFGGVVIGAIEIVINVEADRTEHLLGRRLMNRCHAFWSFGFFAAGIIGALAKQSGLSPQQHLLGIAPIIAIATILTLGQMSPASARDQGNGEQQAAPKFAMPSMGIVVLVAFTLSAMFLEGGSADWSVIYMRDTYAVSPFINGIAFAVGAFAQAMARFFIDKIIEKFGPILVSRVLILILGTGVLIITFGNHPGLALAGFALMGIGASAAFPLAMSAAAQRTDRPAALNVASLAQLSFVAFLVGPPLLGFVAEKYGVRVSFGICLPLVILSWFTSRALAPQAETGKQISNG